MQQTCFHIILMLLVAFTYTSCREDEYIVYSDEQDTGKEGEKGDIIGMYVLCEGNMGSNKATLDYLDLSAENGTIRYLRNIYAERNPTLVKELGDVGNDVKIYGQRLWMVINCSNKVEVARVNDCKQIGKIDIPNCRYVAFDKGYAYISSYVGPVMVDKDAPLGRIYKVDTLTLAKVDSITVGYQPDELCVMNGKLYVANSGGYRVPNYDRTVSVVNLSTFKEEEKIDVAINLFRIRSDKYGQLWVTSRGNYRGEQAGLYWLSLDGSGKMSVQGHIDTPISDMCIVGDSLYYIGVGFNYTTMTNQITYGIMNIRTHQIVTTQLSQAQEIADIEMPYGIIVNPQHKDFYIMDAKNYVSSGELFHFKADGSFDYRVWTGDIPAHAAFVYTSKK